MTLGEIEEEIGGIVNDSSLAVFYKRWINEAVLAIAMDLALPHLRLEEPVKVPITSDKWLFDMPKDFQKQMFKAGVFDPPGTTDPTAANWFPLHIAKRGLDTINDLDPLHTSIDTHPWQIAVQDNQFGIFPKANDTIYMWYFKRPERLKGPDDVPRCIPEAYHHRLVIPKVVIKNFRALQDMVIQPPHQSIQYWKAEYSAGLYGERGGDMGLVNVLAREKPPRRHGGRDPIWTGWRSW